MQNIKNYDELLRSALRVIRRDYEKDPSGIFYTEAGDAQWEFDRMSLRQAAPREFEATPEAAAAFILSRHWELMDRWLAEQQGSSESPEIWNTVRAAHHGDPEAQVAKRAPAETPVVRDDRWHTLYCAVLGAMVGRSSLHATEDLLAEALEFTDRAWQAPSHPKTRIP